MGRSGHFGKGFVCAQQRLLRLWKMATCDLRDPNNVVRLDLKVQCHGALEKIERCVYEGSVMEFMQSW